MTYVQWFTKEKHYFTGSNNRQFYKMDVGYIFVHQLIKLCVWERDCLCVVVHVYMHVCVCACLCECACLFVWCVCVPLPHTHTDKYHTEWTASENLMHLWMKRSSEILSKKQKRRTHTHTPTNKHAHTPTHAHTPQKRVICNWVDDRIIVLCPLEVCH